MAIDCQSVADEELKILRDIQRLLQLISLALTNNVYVDSIQLEEKL